MRNKTVVAPSPIPSPIVVITNQALIWIKNVLMPEIENEIDSSKITNAGQHNDTEEGALAFQPNGNLMAEEINLKKLHDLVKSQLKVIKENTIPANVAGIGRSATVEGINFDYKKTYYLSGCDIPGYKKYFPRNIELTHPGSPLGAQLIGKSVGDTIELGNGNMLRLTEVGSMEIEKELFKIPDMATA